MKGGAKPIELREKVLDFGSTHPSLPSCIAVSPTGTRLKTNAELNNTNIGIFRLCKEASRFKWK